MLINNNQEAYEALKLVTQESEVELRKKETVIINPFRVNLYCIILTTLPGFSKL